MFSFFTQNKPKRVYLDHAGATEVSERAIAQLSRGMKLYGNPSAIHHEGDVASRLLDESRNLCANVLNAHAYEIYFTGSGTESCNLGIMGTYLGFANGKKLMAKSLLPHIITSSIEHPAVLEPVRHLEKQGLIRATYLPVYENGLVKLQDLREALCEETILVSIMYANNEIGTLQPIKDIGRAIDEWKREHGRTFNEYPYFHTDACQAANYCNLDVLRLKCHLMTVNSSKVYGPKGIALLYKREGVRIDPVMYGGGQERGMRSGTESVALARSFAEALLEASELRDQESARLRVLRDFFKDELMKAIPGVTFYGAWEENRQQTTDNRQQNNSNLTTNDQRSTANDLRLPNNINCRIPGIPSDEMIIRLDHKGFAVSHKSACASSETDGSYVIEALGATKQEALENVRITLGRSTSRQDLDRLVKAMKEIMSKYGK